MGKEIVTFQYNVANVAAQLMCEYTRHQMRTNVALAVTGCKDIRRNLPVAHRTRQRERARDTYTHTYISTDAYVCAFHLSVAIDRFAVWWLCGVPEHWTNKARAPNPTVRTAPRHKRSFSDDRERESESLFVCV